MTISYEMDSKIYKSCSMTQKGGLVKCMGAMRKSADWLREPWAHPD